MKNHIDIIRKPFRFVENLTSSLLLASIALLPVIEVVTRFLGRPGIKGSSDYLQHLVLWLTFAGGVLASRENGHISLSIATDILKGRRLKVVRAFAAFVASAVTTAYGFASWDLMQNGFAPDATVGIFPLKYVLAIMPVGFAILTIRLVMHVDGKWFLKLAAALGPVAAFLITKIPLMFLPHLIWPISILLIAASVAGAPVFSVLGGFAAILFYSSSGETTVLANEAYTLISNPIIPTIPLFSLAGFILSESKAGERLMRFFNAAFGWMPGGAAIMATLICAFLTTFTGASGVTIMALGGLLSFVLMKSGYPKNFTYGLLTASGSIGLLFPPSLPVILYGVVAHVNIKHLFVGGVLPGLLMVATLAVYSIFIAGRSKVERIDFKLSEVWTSLIGAFWEILTPLIVLVVYFGGYATIVETGAITAVYTFLVQVFVRRDIKIKDVPKVFIKCVPPISGVLMILVAAMGLSYYIVDAEIPMQLASWVTTSIHSKYLFLLLLNLALIVAGCFLEIFSSIIVLVPIIIPLATAFGINPVHLGIIFLANMELGYLMPPVGLNLFLSSYRFEQPLGKMTANTYPFMIALFVAVLLITYVPIITTGLLRFVG